jgi:hypothetical protein
VFLRKSFVNPVNLTSISLFVVCFIVKLHDAAMPTLTRPFFDVPPQLGLEVRRFVRQ